MGKQRKKRASNSMDELPEEIIILILSMLPVKVLLRVKCVCTLWRSLISNPKFILSATGRERAIAGCSTPTFGGNTPDLERIGFYTIDDDLSAVKLPIPVGEVPGSYVGFQLLGTCNGLVVFCADRHMYIWNPLTTRCRELSQLNALVDRFLPRGSYRIASGLCFDKCSDDYKLVVVNTPMVGELDKIVCVASLKKRENWMDIGFPYEFPNNNNFTALTSGVLVRGHLHWIVMKEKSFEQVIVCFDEGMNKFIELPMPDEAGFEDGGSAFYFGLAVLNGCLCMCRSSPRYTNVLVMRGYGVKHSWTKLCTTVGVYGPLHTIISSKLVLLSVYRFLCACDLERKNCLMSIKGQPVSLKDPPLIRTSNLRNRRTYNLRNRACSNFESADLFIVSGPLIFVESLASIDLI